MQTREMGLEVKRIIKFEGAGTLKAFCDVAIGDLVMIRGLRIVEGKHGLFVSMPRQKGKADKWFDTVSVLTDDTKRQLDEVVMDAYQKECAAPAAA
ncbi:MAG: septation protein SpoVG family protein [Candidatus Omnitrophica bacterium]|nr:septation protein SpoVG family protein [Candidatus Omnitrophota bacterium]